MNTLKDGIQSGNVDLTITSSDAGGFFFIKDGNETVKIPFEIEVCASAFYKGDKEELTRQLVENQLISSKLICRISAKDTAHFLRAYGEQQ